MVLEHYLTELQDANTPLSTARLIHVSAMTSEEVECFRRSWVTLDIERRRQVLSRLIDLAEDNADLDFAAVFRVCLQDPDEDVREKAIAGLSDSEDRSLIDPLITLMLNDPKERIRAAAAVALGRYTMLAELGKLLSRDGPKLEKAMLTVIENGAKAPEVRRRAIEAIGAFSNVPRVKEILRNAYNSPDPKLRASALFGMGRNCDQQWLPILVQALSSEDPELRCEAAGACGETGEETTVPYLIPLARDADAQVRDAAIQALGSIGGPTARKALLQLRQSTSPHIREAAEEALQKLESEEDPLDPGSF
ncbi:MAG: HEAT repeat domain-containing protein [Dehalococcoidia bacterium]|nr:HEAT repeat domain-containing protein [Dehalococcoidia bacterium]